MGETTTLDPITADSPGFRTFYGIPVCSLGEDGDLLALGRHSPLHVIAAMNAYARKEQGLRDLCDGDMPYKPVAESIETLWCVAVYTCEWHDTALPSCEDCTALCEGRSWCVTWPNVTAKTPGSFPAMRWVC